MLLPGVLGVYAVFSVSGVVFLVAAAPADTHERGEIGGWCLALPHDRASISIVCRRINVDYKVDSTHHFAKKLQCKDARTSS